jgi:hypothetical protein
VEDTAAPATQPKPERAKLKKQKAAMKNKLRNARLNPVGLRLRTYNIAQTNPETKMPKMPAKAAINSTCNSKAVKLTIAGASKEMKNPLVGNR